VSQKAKLTNLSKKKQAISDDIEEEIEQSNGSSDDPITESIPSYASHSANLASGKEMQSSSAIEESIQESIPNASSGGLPGKKQVSTEDSIEEESAII